MTPRIFFSCRDVSRIDAGNIPHYHCPHRTEGTTMTNAATYAHNGRKIVTSHICPPIPSRTMDWCAYFDGEEELGNYGYGRTEAEAVADFIDNLDD